MDIPRVQPLPTTVTTANIGEGLAEGMKTGVTVAQQQQALLQKQQEIQMAKTQQSISQVDTLIKSGIELPGLLPYFWPTIATKMNEISPDYKLDPKNPPANIQSFSKSLSDISDGVQGGVISMPQAHDATKHLIRTNFPTAVNAVDPNAGTPDGGPTAPVAGTQPGQPGQPAPTAPAPGPVQPPQPGPAGQPPQPPAVQVDPNVIPSLLDAKAKYDKASALIAQAPISQQKGLREQLDNSSLGQTYKQLLDNHFKSINEQYTQSQMNDRNQYNQTQDTLRAAAGTFTTQSEKFKNVADNFNAFNHLMHLSDQMETQGADTTATVQAEKTALLNFAQMAYPGTGRPGNPAMLETMEKSGPYGTLIAQTLNRLDKGDIMTGKQLKGIRQAALALYQGHEEQQSQLENTYTQNIQSLGGNPSAFIKNLRPQSVHSTSKLFPTQSSDKDPIIGHIVQTKSGPYQYLGGNPNSKNNWAYAGEKGE